MVLDSSRIQIQKTCLAISVDMRGDNATLQGFKMCKKSILIMIRAAVLTAILPVHLSEAEVATFCAQRFWGRCSL